MYLLHTWIGSESGWGGFSEGLKLWWRNDVVTLLRHNCHFGQFLLVFVPLWACILSDRLEIWYIRNYARGPSISVNTYLRRHNVATLLRHNGFFGPFPAIHGGFLATVSELFVRLRWNFVHSIIYQVCTSIYIKLCQRHNDVVTLWRHNSHFARFLGHFWHAFDSIDLIFGTYMDMMKAHRFMWNKNTPHNEVLTLRRHICHFDRFSGHGCICCLVTWVLRSA